MCAQRILRGFLVKVDADIDLDVDLDGDGDMNVGDTR